MAVGVGDAVAAGAVDGVDVGDAVSAGGDVGEGVAVLVVVGNGAAAAGAGMATAGAGVAVLVGVGDGVAISVAVGEGVAVGDDVRPTAKTVGSGSGGWSQAASDSAIAKPIGTTAAVRPSPFAALEMMKPSDDKIFPVSRPSLIRRRASAENV